MLAVLGKPLIHYAVEEAVASGITDLIFVPGLHKRAIEDHFDTSPELEAELEAKVKLQLLDVASWLQNQHPLQASELVKFVTTNDIQVISDLIWD